MELEISILCIERRHAVHRGRRRREVDRYGLPEFQERTLSVDSVVALRCARLHGPDPQAERDAVRRAPSSRAHVVGQVAALFVVRQYLDAQRGG